ncbi:MAG: cytochrome P450 [Ktedonobacteraceae bacterium]|nr:cytochrome P450 [Ktedonobacteraceae bacterium]
MKENRAVSFPSRHAVVLRLLVMVVDSRKMHPGPSQRLLRRRPPGPPWHTLVRNVLHLRRDALGFLIGMHQRYGEVVFIPLPFNSFYVVFHPDGVRHILQEKHRNYNKDVLDYHLLSYILGKGLLTNDGESWLRQRRLIQPAFHRESLAQFVTLMSETTLARLEGWETGGFVESGIPLNLPHELSSLTLSIVSKALFGTDLSMETERIQEAFTSVNHLLEEAFFAPWIMLLPTRQRRLLHIARNTLYSVVEEVIQVRRHRSEKHDDLLALLLETRDKDGEGMTDQQIRDEVVTLMLAGHETTANVLSWTFFLLAQHLHTEEKLQEEYRRVVQGYPETMGDLSRLSYHRMVIEEAMRLYPPAWGLSRRALSADEIGGYFLPKGAYVQVFSYVTQRHPAFWEHPDEFDPERFSEDAMTARPRFAYFPFGGGPRLCIGNQFALCEAQLILATILARYRLQLVPGTVIKPAPLITLRPSRHIFVNVERKGWQEM